MELDPQVSHEEIMSREVELGCESWTFRFRLFLNSSATDIVLVTLPNTAVETATAQCTSCCAMARGHRLNTSIVSLGGGPRSLRSFSGAQSAVEHSLFRPPPPPPLPSLISNKQPQFSGRKVKRSRSSLHRTTLLLNLSVRRVRFLDSCDCLSYQVC